MRKLSACLAIGSLLSTLVVTSACDDAVKMVRLASRAVNAARTINDDGTSSNPETQALMDAAKNACTTMSECAKQQEEDNAEDLVEEGTELFDAIAAACEGSNAFVVLAQVGGKKCTTALREQLECVAALPCPPGDAAKKCEELAEGLEAACSDALFQ